MPLVIFSVTFALPLLQFLARTSCPTKLSESLFTLIYPLFKLCKSAILPTTVSITFHPTQIYGFPLSYNFTCTYIRQTFVQSLSISLTLQNTLFFSRQKETSKEE